MSTLSKFANGFIAGGVVLIGVAVYRAFTKKKEETTAEVPQKVLHPEGPRITPENLQPIPVSAEEQVFYDNSTKMIDLANRASMLHTDISEEHPLISELAIAVMREAHEFDCKNSTVEQTDRKVKILTRRLDAIEEGTKPSEKE